MRAKDAIPAFAELTGEPLSEVRLVDRSLAENGMRAAGRGPKPPEMSQADAVRLVLGVAGAKIASRAHEYVRDASGFSFRSGYHLDESGVPWSVHTGETEAYFNAAWRKALGATMAEFEGLSLKDVLLVIVDNLSREKQPKVSMKVVQGAWVDLSFLTVPISPIQRDGNTPSNEMHFTGALDYYPTPKGAFRRTIEVPPAVLDWVANNFAADAETDAALAKIGKKAVND